MGVIAVRTHAIARQSPLAQGLSSPPLLLNTPLHLWRGCTPPGHLHLGYVAGPGRAGPMGLAGLTPPSSWEGLSQDTRTYPVSLVLLCLPSTPRPLCTAARLGVQWAVHSAPVWALGLGKHAPLKMLVFICNSPRQQAFLKSATFGPTKESAQMQLSPSGSDFKPELTLSDV